MDEAQNLFERFARIRNRGERMTEATRLDLADDAERLAHDARAFLNVQPNSLAMSVIRSIGEHCCMIANGARAR